MTLTKRTQHRFLGTLFLSVLLSCTTAHANEYREARAELVAAYQQADYPAMLTAANKALAARPGYPGALFNLALTQALNSDPAAALATLEGLLVMGVDFGAANQEEFAGLQELDTWDAYQAKVDSLIQPVGTAGVAATHPEAKFVPEGIAIADDGGIHLGSIHTGQLVRLGQQPAVLSDGDGHWSVLGMRFHSDGSLWFASAAVPQLADVGEDEGKTGLFRIDVTTGEISQRAILPQYEDAQVLGDLLIVDDNTIYTTDSLTGAVFRYYIDSNEFETLVDGGKLGSPQGLVLDESGGYLYVADYIGGVYRISILDGSLVRLRVAASINDYGIDGLYRHGNELIAIQNGARPHRVVALQLSENGDAISSSRLLASNLEQFDEPTLGVIRSGDFYFVANSHWNRFDRENKLPKDLIGPIILKLSLD
jgi:hypothetical protein